MNNNCYYFELYNFKKSLLNSFVDATYIIHLVNNGRLNEIKNKINNIQTTDIVYIVYNKGFRNCNKKTFIKSSIHDIIDVNFEIFKHAKINNYNNILVLEDDYIFSDEIKNKNNIVNIEKFIKNKINFQYYLGCLPILTIPKNIYNYKIVLGGAAHSVIYSKYNRELILNTVQSQLYDWDICNILSYPCYTFYKPLCYQIFPITENQLNWIKIFNNNYINNLLSKIARFGIMLLKLNIQQEPGFSFLYVLSKVLYLIFINKS